jgi:protein-S-isoprenylcysteine O-methyltransferase Ste14
MTAPAPRANLARWKAISRRIRVPAGFVFALVYIWLAAPTLPSIAWSLLLVIPGLLLRGWASGHVRKNAALATAGPYAYTRNPLYLGSMLIAYGFAAASRSLWVVGLLTILFLLIYWPVILSEEEFLHSRFPEFAAYTRRVPRLIPRPFGAGNRDAGDFSFALYRQHREYNSLLGSIFLYAALAVIFALRR